MPRSEQPAGTGAPGGAAPLPSLHSAFRLSRAGAWAEVPLCGKREPQPELSEALLASIGELLGPAKKLRQTADTGPRVRDENQHPNLPLGVGPALPASVRARGFGLSVRPLAELGAGNESVRGAGLLHNFNF